MDFAFSPDQLAIRDTIRELVQDKVVPRAAEIDQKMEYPKDIERLFAENGILGIPFPEEYGGVSGSGRSVCMGGEGKANGAPPSSLPAGSERQKRRLAPPLAAGEQMAGYALSEPNSGSDAGAMKTTA